PRPETRTPEAGGDPSRPRQQPRPDSGVRRGRALRVLQGAQAEARAPPRRGGPERVRRRQGGREGHRPPPPLLRPLRAPPERPPRAGRALMFGDPLWVCLGAPRL